MRKTITLHHSDGWWRASKHSKIPVCICHPGLSEFFKLKKNKPLKLVISDKKLPDSYECEKFGYAGPIEFCNVDSYGVATTVSMDRAIAAVLNISRRKSGRFKFFVQAIQE